MAEEVASSYAVCETCERGVERCRLCDDESCENPTCYRCLIFDAGQSLDQPHAHGG